MPPKRKRSSSPPTSLNRAKPPAKKRGRPRKIKEDAPETPGSVIQHPHGEVDTEQYYTVRTILEEDEKRYKIDWADGPNGTPYTPTWEPKRLVNKAAVEDWEAIKAERRRAEQDANSTRSSPSPQPRSLQSDSPKKKRGRPRKYPKSEVTEPAPKKPRGRPRKSHIQSPESTFEGFEDDRDQVDNKSPQLEEEETARSTPVHSSGPSLEIPDSYPEIIQQRDIAAERLLKEAPTNLDNQTHPSKKRRFKSPEVRISPRQVELEDLDYSTDFTPSSEIISGTQPPVPSQSQVDAAAAPNLTQKHSQYEPQDSTRSEETTGSVLVTSSSSVHTFSTPHQFPVGTIIPDSQAIDDSISYIPSESRPEDSQKLSGSTESLTKSGESSKLSDLVESQDQVDLGSQHSVVQHESQHIDFQQDSQHTEDHQESEQSGFQHTSERAIAHRPQLPVVDALQDKTTQSVDTENLSADNNNITGPVAEREEAPQPIRATSPVSPVAARATSSVPSLPPNTDSSNLFESQVQFESQFQHRQPSPTTFGEPFAIEQAAQQPRSIDFDTTTSTAQEAASSQFFDDYIEPPLSSPISVNNGTQPASNLLLVQSIEPSQQDPSTGFSGQFATQIFPSQEPLLGHTITQLSVVVETPIVTQSVPRPSENSLLPSVPSRPEPSLLAAAVQHQSLIPPGTVISIASTSSPIPAVPSQDIGTFGSSAPSPLVNFSDLVRTPESDRRISTMTPTSSRPPAKGKVAERLAALRAARASSTATPAASPKPASAVPARLQSPALQDREARSPSMVPAVEIPAKEAPEQYFRSERYETLLPGDEPESHQHGESGTATFEPMETSPKPSNSYNVRIIPVNFGEQQRDHYKQTISYRKDLVNDFASKIWPADSTTTSKVRRVFDELRKIVLHPDLVNEEAYTQPSQVDARYKAQWDVDTSVKFRFLKHYFATARVFRLHTLLLVEPGRIVEMLRTFLKGNDVGFQLASSSINGEDAAAKPSVTILTTDCEAVNLPSPDLIISLQGSISDQKLTALQAKLSQPNAPIPAVLLMVPKTIEHIERVMPAFSSEAERLHVLMGTTTAYRNEAGRERDESSTAEKAASKLVDFLLSPLEWPFDGLPDLQLFEPKITSQATTDSQIGSSNETSNGNGVKRPLDCAEAVQENAKRAKTGQQMSFGTTGNQNIDASYVSDSISSQQAATIKSLRDEMERKEREAEATLRELQSRLQEHVQALEILQYQHEEQRQSLYRAETERDTAIETAKAATLRIGTLQTSVSTLKAERADLQDQLQIAKEATLNHTIPDLAEFEALKIQIAVGAADKAKLLHKVKTTEESLDYLRDQYQTASNSAALNGKANAALEAQVTDLQARVQNDQSKTRAMTLSSLSLSQSSRIEQLEAMLKTREQLLQRKEEEITRLKESGRGRMTTRQSSVPRTPRIGSPLAAAGASASATISRQSSPAAGKVPHPLSKAG